MPLPEWYQDEKVRNQLAQVSTATLTTQLFKRGFRTRFMNGVAPLRTGHRMVGAAKTFRYIPMREDIDTLDYLGQPSNSQRKAIDEIEAGQVLVIDAMRRTDAGSLGSILALRLQVRGAAGIVTDGAYRDTTTIRELSIPAFAAGQNANTNLTVYHPADIDVPIGCGGVMVEPGDAIVGDDEGVVVIPSYLAREVAHDAVEQEIREDFITERVGSGMTLVGTYPMNEETRQEYDAWHAKNKRSTR